MNGKASHFTFESVQSCIFFFSNTLHFESAEILPISHFGMISHFVEASFTLF